MKQPESKTFVPYEVSSRRLIEELTNAVGFNPDPSKYFKKTPKGYLIHTSFSWPQLIVGIVLPLFLLLVTGWLYIKLMRDPALDTWFQRRETLIQYEFLAFSGLTVLGGLLILTIRRVSYLDPTNHSIRITTSILFFSSTRELQRHEIENIHLNRYIQASQDIFSHNSFGVKKMSMFDYGRAKQELNEVFRANAEPGAIKSFWTISLQKRNHKLVPLTMKLFSDSKKLILETKGNDKDCNKLACDAWALAFLIGVPLHFVAEDTDVVIRSPGDVSVLTDKEKRALNNEKENIRERARKLSVKNAVTAIFEIIIAMFVLYAVKGSNLFFKNTKEDIYLTFICLIVIGVVLLFIFIIYIVNKKRGKGTE